MAITPAPGWQVNAAGNGVEPIGTTGAPTDQTYRLGPTAAINNPNENLIAPTAAPARTYASVSPQQNTQPSREPAVVSSSSIDSVIPQNKQTLSTLSQKGTYVGQDGHMYYSDGSLVPAPTNAIANGDGTWSANGQTYNTGPNFVDNPENDPDIKNINTLLDSLKASSDAATKAQLDAIHAQYGALIGQQKDTNNRANSTRQQALLMGGGARYAPMDESGIMNAQVSFGLQQIQNLEAAEQSALAQATAAGQANDQRLMDRALSTVQDLRKQKQEAAQKVNDQLMAASKKQQDAQAASLKQMQQASRDSAVAGLVQQGVTDPAKLLQYLNYDESGKQVGDFTAEEIGKTLKAIAENTGAAGIKGLTGDVGNFYTLKNTPGALPASILALPADKQLAAYIKLVNQAKGNGYTLGPNSVRYDADGHVIGTGGGGGGGGGTNPFDSASVSQQAKDHAAGVLSGNETMQQVPAKWRDQVAHILNSQDQTMYSPLSQSRFTMAANRIVSNFIKLPQYELTANGLPYLERIDAAIKTPGSVSDQDLLDSLTKLNTAGNAITDAQVKLVTDGRSWADSVSVWSHRLGNGGVLSTSQRNQIQQIAKQIYENYRKGYQPVYNQVTKQLSDAGIPEAFWTIPDLNNLGAQAYPEYFGVPNHPNIGSSDSLSSFLSSAPAPHVTESSAAPIDWALAP